MPPPTSTRPPSSVRGHIATVVVLFILGLNARPSLTSLAALVADLSLAPVAAIAVAALPVLALGVGAFASGALGRRWSPTAIAFTALAGNTVALAMRGIADSSLVMVGTLASAAAVAALAVIVPALIRTASIGHIGSLTCMYGVGVGLGATAGALVTPILGDLTGPHAAAAAWAVVPALSAAACVHPTLRAALPPAPVRDRNRGAFRPDPTSRLLGAYLSAVCATTMPLMAWTPSILLDAGHTTSQAGGLAALALLVGVPTSTLIPKLTVQARSQLSLVAPVAVSTTAGASGLLVAPTAYPALWMSLIGIGYGAFIHATTLITLRSPAPETAMRWSSSAQGAGFMAGMLSVVITGTIGFTGPGWAAAAAMICLLGFSQAAIVAIPRLNMARNGVGAPHRRGMPDSCAGRDQD
jgi:CP family cyanate transporter-like MFS transporter